MPLDRAIGPVSLDRGDFELSRQTTTKPARPRIRCPHCAWQPRRSSSWTCMPVGYPEYYQRGCGHSWNTFDTRGLCPGCSHQWLHTSCLSCNRWALHEAWYERERRDQP